MASAATTDSAGDKPGEQPGNRSERTSDRFDRPDLPQVFGRYLLLKRLSRGGMGEIFLSKLGEIQGFEKPVIIKKVLPQLAADQEFVKRFIDEAQVAIKLTHANIAPVYEVGKVDGDYFLAIEYVEGRDLRRLVGRCLEERFRLPPDLCLYIGRELANGLGYAHRRTDTEGKALSLVHCDISPPNVMVSFEGEVKVIDFGIAKSAIRIAGSNPNIGFGKFGYMAPEQLVKGGVVDKRTDIYAAGVVLYELLTGERLFQFPDGADYRQIARIVTRGEFVKPSKRVPGLDPSLDPIVSRALASKAADRYQTAEEFRDAIQAKLSQMNPTISSDALAALMRRLFADEIVQERALIAQTRAFDVEEYRDEFAGSVGHTVTFARAGLLPRRPGPSQSLPAVSDGSHSRSLIIGALVAFAMLSGGLVTWLAARHQAPPPPTPREEPTLAGPLPSHPTLIDNTTTIGPASPQPAVTPTTPPAAAMLPPLNTVQVTPLVSPNAPSPAAAPHHVPHHAAAAGVTHPARPVDADDADVPPPHLSPHPTDEESLARSKTQVESKFRTVKGEYEAFSSEYGARLEPEWNAITHEITLGKPAEKWPRVNSLIDGLRRDMARVRKGD